MGLKQYFTKRKIKEFLLINLGVCLMAFAYSVLLDPNNIIIGGIGGIATILRDVGGDRFPSSLIILILNIVLLFIGLFFVGKSFFIKTLYASLIYPVYTYIFELLNENFLNDMIPNISNVQTVGIDSRIVVAGAYLVIVLFGAVISGLGLGLALRNGASTGGVDIVQQIFLKYFKMPFSVSLIFIDGAIVLSAGIYFHDIFTILYGALFIYLSGVVMDTIIFSGFNSRCVNIVTSKPYEIRDEIYRILERGVTIVPAKGGYTNQDRPIIICVMHNSEFYKMKEIIRNIDERAFIYVTRASEVHGEGFSPDILPPEEIENGSKNS